MDFFHHVLVDGRAFVNLFKWGMYNLILGCMSINVSYVLSICHTMSIVSYAYVLNVISICIVY